MKNIQLKFVIFMLSFSIIISINAQTDINMTTHYQGYNRSFRVHIPTTYDPSHPTPIVLVYHGGGISNSLEIKNRTRVHLIGDTANFITIYPQALLGSWADSRGTAADLAGIDDVGFTSFILDTIESLYNIDENRIYAAGMSTGGVFTQRLALQFNYRIAAFASVGSSMYTALLAYFPPSRKIPMLYMVGTSDRFNLYYGGKGLSNFYNINTDTAAASWAAFDNCVLIPSIYNFPDINTTDNSTVTRISYSPCQNCSEVVLYRINNGGHTWPGGLNNNPPLGVANHDISGSHEIWAFFNKHQLYCTGENAGEGIITLLESLGLPNGLKNSMSAKIGNAIASCSNGNETAAINQLNSFINQVNAKRGNELTNAEANQLVAFAQSLIYSIQNGTADCGSNMPMTIPEDNALAIQNEFQAQAALNVEETIRMDSLEKGQKDNDILLPIIYPNPATTEIKIQYRSANNFNIDIINSVGQTIIRTQNQNTINIAQLQNGVYYLHLTDHQNTHTRIIVIQH